MNAWLSRFSRITTPGRTFLPEIDGLRFVAIIAVIAYHVRAITAFHFGVSLSSPAGQGDPVNETFSAGALGVSLFFAVSGFILALPFARQHLGFSGPVSLRGYYLRRLTRLEPPYIFHLFVLFVLCCTVYRFSSRPEFGQNQDLFHYSLPHLGASLIYSNGFIYRAHPSPNVVLWTLEIEVQFYILAPLIASLFRISRTAVRRAVITGLIVVFMVVPNLLPLSYLVCNSLFGHLQFFLVGFLWCDWYLVRRLPAPGPTFRWDIFWVGSVFLIVAGHRLPWFFLAFPWLIFLVVAGSFQGRIVSRILSNAWITTIGGMCYTIYMYHWLMISALVRLTMPFHAQAYWLTLLIQFVIMTPIILAVCAGLFILFERPFMQRDWPARFGRFLRSIGKPRTGGLPPDTA